MFHTMLVLNHVLGLCLFVAVNHVLHLFSRLAALDVHVHQGKGRLLDRPPEHNPHSGEGPPGFCFRFSYNARLPRLKLLLNIVIPS